MVVAVAIVVVVTAVVVVAVVAAVAALVAALVAAVVVAAVAVVWDSCVCKKRQLADGRLLEVSSAGDQKPTNGHFLADTRNNSNSS